MQAIGINALFVRPGIVGGAEFMLYNLVEGLLAQGRERIVLYANPGPALDASFLGRHADAVGTGRLEVVQVPGRGSRFVRETLALPGALRARGVKSVIMPNYFTPPTVRGCRVVTAILDLQYAHWPQYFSLRKRWWLRLAHRMTLSRADCVVAISAFVRDDVLRVYGRNYAKKVRVIPIGVSWERFAQGRRPDALPAGRPFVLSVASQYPHKNLETLLRAFALVARRVEHDLVLVGQDGRKLVGTRRDMAPALADLADALGIRERVHFTGHVLDTEVGYCYEHASLFVLPSLFEGFGMPAVEALGFNLPTITTRCGSLVEVTLGLASYLDEPKDHTALGAMMLSALGSPEAFRPGSQQARNLRDYYSPIAAAKAYLDALKFD